MLTSRFARRGMVTAPHHLAAQAGLAVLRDGGNAIEAMVAAAATCSVVYPHMTGLGGDGFWIIAEPGRPPLAIDACGAAGSGASIAAAREAGLDRIPSHGPWAASTVAGTLSGWQSALEMSTRWGGRLPLSRLFEEAIHYAREGFPVSVSQERCMRRLLGALKAQPGFADTFLEDGGRVPRAGTPQSNPALADTLEILAREGLDSFYRGAVGQAVAAELRGLGCPLRSEDFARHRPVRRRPLTLALDSAVLHATPPPTQGLTTLMLLGLYQRLGVREGEGIAHIHGLVEAAKVAYRIRDTKITDPRYMRVHAATYLSGQVLDGLAAEINPVAAAPWPSLNADGDTVWMGAADSEGRMVSFIQSLYQGFGSGLVLRETGLTWHNRGRAFALDEDAANPLQPGRKPFHTLNPVFARLRDGRLMAFGTMGGDGQPQTLAAVFSRHVLYGQDLQGAISAPRWVLGRGWQGPADDLKVESRMAPELVEKLRSMGHQITVVDPFDELMGHAGAIVCHPNGTFEGATDPRADGSVAAF